MKIVDSIWFNTIGIVVIETAEGKHKAYIGLGDGFDESADQQLIARIGMPFNIKMSQAYWPQYDFIY